MVLTALCLQRIWTSKEFGWWEQPRVCISKIGLDSRMDRKSSKPKLCKNESKLSGPGTEVGIFISLLEWSWMNVSGTIIAQRFLLWFQVLHHWFSARKQMAQRVTKCFKEYASKTCLLGESFKDIFFLENFQFQIRFDEILKVRKPLHCRTGRWTPPAAKNHSLRPLSNRFVAKIRECNHSSTPFRILTYLKGTAFGSISCYISDYLRIIADLCSTI